MLRIITEQRGATYHVHLHGSVAGEWIGVLERYWQELLDRDPSAVITIGVSNVVFIDSDGEQLFRRMADRGVDFDGTGCMNRYVIEKISGGV